MSIVADYAVIRDSPVALQSDGDIDWQDGFELFVARRDYRAILQYKYRSNPNASNLGFQFSINGAEEPETRVTGAAVASTHEVVVENVLSRGPNTIEARIVGGTGEIYLSDFVLWFQRDLPGVESTLVHAVVGGVAVADYLVIRDSPVSLQSDGDIDWQHGFELPDRLRPDARTILQYKYRSDPDASDLRFQFSINGAPEPETSVTGAAVATIHEVVVEDTLQHGSNMIEARIVGGIGRVRVSDVVLWFSRSTG